MAVKLVTPATDEVVTLEEAKAHLRVDTDDDDDLIEALISAAIAYVEKTNSIALTSQEWDLFLDAFPDGEEIEIPLPPLIEVDGVFYQDNAGSEQEWSADNYVVDNAASPGRLKLLNGGWPSARDAANAIRIRFRAGYVEVGSSPEAPAVPAPIKQGILLLIGTMYENRETIVIGQTAVELPWAAQQLLKPYNANKGFA